jgi:hypothetical protein
MLSLDSLFNHIKDNVTAKKNEVQKDAERPHEG